MLFQIDRKLFGNHALYRSSGFAVSKLLFRLTLKLRLFNLHADDRGQALPDIVSHEVLVRILDQLVASGVIVEGFGEGVLKSGKMGFLLPES